MKRLNHLIGTGLFLIIIALAVMHPFLAVTFFVLYCLLSKN